MTAGRIESDLVTDAYRLFLGRAPNLDNLPAFENFGQLVAMLMQSDEFNSSPRSKKNGMGWPEAQYFVAPQKKLMYCPIGKNACSFLKVRMVNAAEHPHALTIGNSIHFITDRVKTGIQLSDYALGDAQAMLSDPDMFRFALLRDPARRMLSAYIEKFLKNRMDIGNQSHTASVVRAVQTERDMSVIDFHQGISFREFVDHVVTQPADTLDPHWRPQNLYLGDYEWPHLYAFDDLPRLVRDIERQAGVALAAPPINSSGSGIGVSIDGADRLLPPELDGHSMISAECYLTQDLQARIEAYFAADYALLDSLT